MNTFNKYPDFLDVIELDNCDSTNNYLKENYMRLKERLPVLITSLQQTRGRGRRDRSWESKKNMGLYTSFGFYLKIGSKLNLLPLTAGISVIETLQKIMHTRCGISLPPGTNQTFGLKWPNDVLYHNRKIAGVLIENTIFKEEVFCVTGIGINLNHKAGDFPDSLKNTATSLQLISGKTIAIEDVNQTLAHIFFTYLMKLENKQEEKIIEKANGYSSFLKGQQIAFHRDGRIMTGIFRGINHDGGIILKDPQGGTKIHYTGEPQPPNV
jgi:BirA family biotin operon repressor/biotin-[acetyl-CoA-carboxylase] ligase